ncbi:MAG: hypothetical protein JJU29_16060 [Verrucomicrobia bacterium]|nr:hypothetical protein [Verrucomicrobiota bacterium]MCH8512936.1 KAP family NTPase [Kiritimatiellia bacterium]
MKDDNQKKYAFKLLPEKAVDDDAFEDKTHERLGAMLADIIMNHDGPGQTIGLEGPWGSGKSTVINLLKKKLSKKKYKFFCFDAWAHEGDPLRRIFLESLANSLIINDGKHSDELENLKNTIANRTQTKTTTTKRSMTWFGNILSISL